MKRNIPIIIISCGFIYLLFTKQSVISLSVINSSKLFLIKIMPSILPLFIMSKILINYNIPYYVAKLFHHNMYGYIFFMGMISGCPNNAIMIKDLLENKLINIKQANKYIMCSFFSNPLFLYTILINIFNIKITIIIIGSHYLANLFIYLIKPCKNHNIRKIEPIKFNVLIVNTIKSASVIFTNIYITIVIFNILIYLLPKALLPLNGLIELTQGLNYLQYINYSLNIKIILALIYISFGGLSIIFQTLNVLSETKIESRLFIKSRFYQIIISIVIFLTASIFLT